MAALHIDIETYSSVNLADCGVYKYVESEDFEILLFAYSDGESPVIVIDLTRESLPSELVNQLCSPDVIKYAHNAQFERICLSKYLGRRLPPEQWRCTMFMANEYGLPSSLAQLSKALGLPEDKAKMAEGKQLIKWFCMPYKGSRRAPEDYLEKWQRFIEYNRQDVVAELEVYNRLSKKRIIHPREYQYWFLDQRINDYGLRVDTDLVRTVIEYGAIHTQHLVDEVNQIQQGLNVNSVLQLKNYIEEHDHIKLESLRKTDLDELLKRDDLCNSSHRLLEIRKELAKTSVKKYEAFNRATCQDERIHGAFQFYGANRTGRWAGRLIQPQNFPRNAFDDIDEARELVKTKQFKTLEMLYGSLNEVFSTLIRTAVIPSENHAFVIADYSAIEARVIAWLSNESWRQQVFAEGGDIYCASASQMFKVPVVKHGENGHLRQKGKIAELALGYGGGIGALKAMGGDKMGLSDEEMEEIVRKWRAASPHICQLWKSVENCGIRAIRNPNVPQILDKKLSFLYKQGDLYIQLPSGRSICYAKATLEKSDFGHKIIYAGVDQTRKTWSQLETWGGKLVENVVQAIARDCLAEAMRRIEPMCPIVMHIHDEIVAEVPECASDVALEEIQKQMGQPLSWAKGLILTAEGFISKYYRKD